MRSLLWQILVPAVVGTFTGICVGALAAAFEDGGLRLLVAAPAPTAALASLLALPLTYAVTRVLEVRGRLSGSELYIETVLTPGARLEPRGLPVRIGAAIATVGLGGSQGFEAVSALLGATLADVAARLRRLRPPPEAERMLMAAGASAGIAAVFSSAAVGLLYGLEVPYRRDLDARPLVPAAIASACAFGARVWVAGAHPLIEPGSLPRIDLAFAGGCMLLGVLCGVGGRAFALAQNELQRLGRASNATLRVVGSALALGGLAWAGYWFSGNWITLGPGHIATAWLIAGRHPAGLVALILLIRTAGTLVCVYGGGGGGVFTALACTGAFLGSLVATAFAWDESLVFPFVGAACFLSAGYRIPLCCILWVGEASGDLALTLGGTVAIAIAQAFAGDASVSEAKREARTAAASRPRVSSS